MERKTKPQTEAHSPGLTASVVVCLLGQSPNAGIADTHTATSGLTVVLFLLSLVLVTEVRAVHMLGKCSPLRSTPPPHRHCRVLETGHCCSLTSIKLVTLASDSLVWESQVCKPHSTLNFLHYQYFPCRLIHGLKEI